MLGDEDPTPINAAAVIYNCKRKSILIVVAAVILPLRRLVEMDFLLPAHIDITQESGVVAVTLDVYINYLL